MKQVYVITGEPGPTCEFVEIALIQLSAAKSQSVSPLVNKDATKASAK